MNELHQRLLAQTGTSPLMRNRSGFGLTAEGRQLQVALREEVAHGIIKKTQLAVAKEVALDAMDGLIEVDDYRKSSAGNDPDRNLLLCEAELAYVAEVKRIQRGHNL